jgi:hypothetical protein
VTVSLLFFVFVIGDGDKDWCGFQYIYIYIYWKVRVSVENCHGIAAEKHTTRKAVGLCNSICKTELLKDASQIDLFGPVLKRAH